MAFSLGLWRVVGAWQQTRGGSCTFVVMQAGWRLDISWRGISVKNARLYYKFVTSIWLYDVTFVGRYNRVRILQDLYEVMADPWRHSIYMKSQYMHDVTTTLLRYFIIPSQRHNNTVTSHQSYDVTKSTMNPRLSVIESKTQKKYISIKSKGKKATFLYIAITHFCNMICHNSSSSVAVYNWVLHIITTKM